MFSKILVISLVVCLAAAASVHPKEEEDLENFEEANLVDSQNAAVDSESKFFFNFFSIFKPKPIWIPLPGLDPVPPPAGGDDAPPADTGDDDAPADDDADGDDADPPADDDAEEDDA